MKLEGFKVQAIFPHDKDTLDMLWNRYVKEVFNCWEYKNGRIELEYKNYKTLYSPFNVIKFGDFLYVFPDGTTDVMEFNPPNCPYCFEHSFIAKEYLKKDYSHYTTRALDREFNFVKFVKSNEGGKMLSQFVFESTMLYLMILYMSEKPEYAQSEEIPSWKAKQEENEKEYKSSYKYTKVVKKYNIFKNEQEKKIRQMQCPSWSVRGHYRHYKNGKTVFVKAYSKGKNRDKQEPEEKIYKICEGNTKNGIV